jgi:hypothetical protein
MFKNPENAGMVGEISFQAKSYLFSVHEMFKNSGSSCCPLPASKARVLLAITMIELIFISFLFSVLGLVKNTVLLECCHQQSLTSYVHNDLDAVQTPLVTSYIDVHLQTSVNNI